MGNCVPTQKSTEPAAAMKLQDSVNHSQENTVQTESLTEEEEFNSKLKFTTPVPCETSIQDLSNREEMYFDSEPWLDSDVEDFLSVNGDLTPLGNSSPLHQSNLTTTPPCEESTCIDKTENPIPQTSQIDMKKQLIEFFRESFNNNGNQNNIQAKAESKPSECRNTNPNKQERSAQCCLPNLVGSLSFSERKKKRG
ncbi:hypothetical protein JCGZ_17944 [Jatropha curcas]|uniref:Uncharacterized protein n=1 Tax=Jatropha curcas TaxID=180498 RepID=A0A067JS63_JATCU|nr:uncharacterized protein At3g27210 [Jatropha curcas]KDP26786.1 hypothetical protein JCGZ_17944 [Jatropha curcas]